jgi:hydrogen cyanide synthase HcnC
MSERDRQADVIVVGGGVIGCAVAYELARQSISVLLLDKSLPGRATSASAGGLWPIGEAVGLGCGVIYYQANRTDTGGTVETEQGPEPLPPVFRDFLAASNAQFPCLASELRDASGIDIECDEGVGLLFVMFNEQECAFAQRLAANVPRDLGMQVLSAQEALRIEPLLSPEVFGGVLLPGEHQVNPMLLAEAFKRAALAKGARFRSDCCVEKLCIEGRRVVGVQLDNERLHCKTVVNAAGAWAGELAATAGIKLPISPVRGQIVLSEALPRTLRACLSTSGCYLAQKRHGEVLIGSTTERAGFDVSVTIEAIQSLSRAAIRVVPMLQNVRVKRVWAGLRPGTPDELPILGKVADLDGYVNATGGFRTGIVAAPLTGRVVSQVVAGKEPEFPIDAFNQSRFSSE